MPNPPIVIAHRGASAYLPEHTLEAKALAHAMEADFIEQDLVLSRDDEIVVIHDIYLETVTNVASLFPGRKREDGHFYVIDFDWAELRQLDAHERIDPETGRAVYPDRYPPEGGNFKLHRLGDEIKLIQDLNRAKGKRVGIYPEIKKPAFHHAEGRDISKRVLDVLNAHGYSGKNDLCYLQCFDPDELKRIRSHYHSRLKLVQLLPESLWWEAALYPSTIGNRMVLEIAQYADGIGPPLHGKKGSALEFWYRYETQLPNQKSKDKDTKIQGLTPFSIMTKLAHDRGLEVHPYTFKKEMLPKGSNFVAFTANFLMRTGVDGFFTDFPDLGAESVRSISEKGVSP